MAKLSSKLSSKSLRPERSVRKIILFTKEFLLLPAREKVDIQKRTGK
jgi:hypothetical protein